MDLVRWKITEKEIARTKHDTCALRLSHSRETYLFVRFLSLENNELVDSENWKRINFDCIRRFYASSHDIQSCDSKWVLMAELMVLAVIQSRCEKFSQTVYQCIWIGNGV